MPDSNPHSDYFNKHLKGKYAYWVQMRYIVSFDHMRHEGYVACEEDITKLLLRADGSWPRPYGAPAIDVYEPGILDYVDSIETDRINNTIEFRMRNSYSPDDNITVDELKKFRTWLAKELLKMDQTELGEQKNTYFTQIESHVLNYYAKDMYDETLKILTDFGQIKPSFESINVSSCGCGNENISSLYNTTIDSCNSINIYKKNIYDRMVEMFSSVDFWSQWAPEFINEFKKYIDNIIKCDFKLSKQNQWVSEFADCTCKNKTDQESLVNILKRLSISLGYIRDGKVSGYKNYISDSLYDWSRLLYERMYW